SFNEDSIALSVDLMCVADRSSLRAQIHPSTEASIFQSLHNSDQLRQWHDQRRRARSRKERDRHSLEVPRPGWLRCLHFLFSLRVEFQSYTRRGRHLVGHAAGELEAEDD